MTFDIIEYLGKFEDGVLALISLNYEDVYYDATFFYKENFVTLTTDEKLEEIIGEVEEWSGYNNLVLDIMKKVVPYDEIITRLDPVDVTGLFEE
jgi:putative heme iron utilization protein